MPATRAAKATTRRAVGRDVDHDTEPSEVRRRDPSAQGVDVFVFGGPSLREAVQRYNLFSGGGALPPRWGLGFWYRCHLDFTQAEVGQDGSTTSASARIPCDVSASSPGWQTKAYSCSFVSNNQKFPDPSAMIEQLGADHDQVNLWEHAFTHPAPHPQTARAPLGRLPGVGWTRARLPPARSPPHLRRISR